MLWPCPDRWSHPHLTPAYARAWHLSSDACSGGHAHTHTHTHTHTLSSRTHAQWDHSAKLVKFGFTTNESLVLLGRDGVYRLYPISPATSATSGTAASSVYSQHSLAHDVGEDAFISDARIYEGGMLILLSTHQFLEVKGWPERDDALVAADGWDAGQSPVSGSAAAAGAGPGAAAPTHGKGRVERLVDSGLERAPSAWCVLTPEQSTSRQAEVLLSSGEALLVVDQLEVQDQVRQIGDHRQAC